MQRKRLFSRYNPCDDNTTRSKKEKLEAIFFARHGRPPKYWNHHENRWFTEDEEIYSTLLDEPTTLKVWPSLMIPDYSITDENEPARCVICKQIEEDHDDADSRLVVGRNVKQCRGWEQHVYVNEYTGRNVACEWSGHYRVAEDVWLDKWTQ
jgi:hypothetical protein